MKEGEGVLTVEVTRRNSSNAIIANILATVDSSSGGASIFTQFAYLAAREARNVVRDRASLG